jgi:acyl carrier protein
VIVSEAQVLAEIRRVVERELQLPRPIEPTSRLVDDLGLDSLTLTTLAVALEDRFQVILSDEEATRIQTVEELARCVVSRAVAAAS